MCLKRWNKLIFSTLIVVFFSCESDKKETFPLTVKFELSNANQISALNETLLHENNYRYLINLFKVYFHKIHLHTSAGDSVQISTIRLIDFQNSGSLVFESPIRESGSFFKISGFIGIPTELNGTNNPNFDPSIYEIDSPLNLNNNMYWTWNTGYIFLKMEGKADTSINGNNPLNFNWFYHVGLDTNYTYFTKSYSFQFDNTKKQELVFKVDLATLFSVQGADGVDIKTEPASHTTDQFALAQKIMRRFVESLKPELR